MSTYYAIPADVLDVIAPKGECGACKDSPWGQGAITDPDWDTFDSICGDQEIACPDCHGTGHTRALRWETLVEVMDGAPFARVNDGWEPLETMDEPENRQTWAAWERLDDKSDGLYALMPERVCETCKGTGHTVGCPHCNNGTRPSELVRLEQLIIMDNLMGDKDVIREAGCTALLKMPEGEVIE